MRRCSFVPGAELPYSNIVLCCSSSTGYSNSGGGSFLGLWLSLPQTLWRTWERGQKNRSHFSVSFPRFVSAFLLLFLLNQAPQKRKFSLTTRWATSWKPTILMSGWLVAWWHEILVLASLIYWMKSVGHWKVFWLELKKVHGGTILYWNNSTQTFFKGWVDVPAYTLVIKIVSRYTTRFFAGPELSMLSTTSSEIMLSYALFTGSDSKYTTIMQNFVSHIAQDGPKLRMYPNWLRPWVSTLLLTTSHSESCVQFCQSLSIRQKRKGTGNWELFASDHRKARRKGHGSGELWSRISESMSSRNILLWDLIADVERYDHMAVAHCERG